MISNGKCKPSKLRSKNSRLGSWPGTPTCKPSMRANLKQCTLRVQSRSSERRYKKFCLSVSNSGRSIEPSLEPQPQHPPFTTQSNCVVYFGGIYLYPQTIDQR